MSNMILIGMTGSGKSTIGKLLSERLQLSFIDMDATIEKKAGLSIPELFQKGEPVFRALETSSCKELSLNQNSVISTGGGVIVKEENHKWLKKAGLIIWIDRPLDQIAKDINTSNRPLLKNGTEALYALYEARESLYRELADIIVVNDFSLEQTVDSIIEMLPEHFKRGDGS